MKRFFALSRTTHGVLDLAMPGFVALLWLGAFPPFWTIVLSLFTAFAAYTAIYALNDLVGIAVDKEKFTGGINAGYSVEASALRYPLAQNALSIRNGALWFAGWFIAAMIGAYFLNPPMPQGDKDAYSDKQKRQAEHIEDSVRERGGSEEDAGRIAWATVNKQDGGGKKSGSGRAKHH